jgi:hypothetical protein
MQVSSRLVVLASLAVAAGCASESAKQGAPAASGTPAGAAPSTSVAAAAPAPVDSPAATSVASGDVAAPSAAPSAVAPDAAPNAAAPNVTAPGDTAGPKLIPGRTKTDMQSFLATVRAGEKALPTWPKGPTALSGALLPQNRIVAYYGNPHSKKMGVIGEYPEQQMLGMLDKQVAQWRAADPATPVIPAIHLVTVVAAGYPGPDNMWRRRETPEMIEKTYGWAKSRKGLLFLDIQGGHSTLPQELPLLLKYLERPDVHLGIDPEFYMHHAKEGVRPSAKVGQMMASDVNYVIQTLDKLVAEKHLPPKILVVHRWTKQMVPDAESIHPTPRVQVVMDMDGWGPPWLKFDSYRDYIVTHPVQYTGFKLFYHHDTKKGDALLTPKEVLQLKPRPLYIQYQ